MISADGVGLGPEGDADVGVQSRGDGVVSGEAFAGRSAEVRALCLVELQPVHAAVASALQAQAMAAGTGDRAWTPEAIADLLRMPGSYGYLATDSAAVEPLGFVFCRSVAGEGEILVLAVVPALWRRGLGRALLSRALGRARALGLQRMLLEVAVDNRPARSLYEAAGFRAVGRRPGYYHRADGRQVDALTLECEFSD